ncbi:MAG: hypothetical protein U9N63_00840, partial [Pseudomonadota bacterium]|nr:hypothetical protein [Pseudomonadota bacterium]
SQNGYKICLMDTLVVELGKKLVRDVVLIIVLKAIEDYFQKIDPVFNDYVQTVEKHHDFSSFPSSVAEESGDSCIESRDVVPTITIKKKGRSKIRL